MTKLLRDESVNEIRSTHFTLGFDKSKIIKLQNQDFYSAVLY